MAVLEDPLNVSDLGVVLGRALPQPSALTHFGDMDLVVVAEDLVLQDGVGNLRGAAEQVNLEQLGLEVSVLDIVLLECLKEETGALLDPATNEASRTGRCVDGV